MFTFLSGRLCLDLTTTLQVRHHDRPRETLTAPGDVRSWLERSGLVAGVEVDAAGLERVRRLREAVHDAARAVMEHREPDPADVALLNRTAGHPPLTPVLADGAVRHHGDLDQALSTLARDAIDLLAGPAAGRVRQCAHPDCTRLFLDASHAGRRRWCGMTACGNKAKSAAYRRRRSP
ncbi:ABATE domain-containing protein [Actinomadura kijaniata]|uniref:Putative RNA-binding Zn ribbon-like protein n=1 Tax=Actinomadura namibiensis TaxID=182080 RepID=A0A7W3LW00_ACTNM|nr:ABATE domain-containing protein [Actinomadura namibiensis]MBA8955351.1 putative RNA-binding Zn ribbon-like protein [Actinomadura namibiensis]